MFRYQLLICALLMTASARNKAPMSEFKEEQLKFSRVRTAYSEKEVGVKALFDKAGIEFPEYDLLIQAFKKEQKLEVWAKSKANSKYQHVTTYDFCMLSGILGPKRREGDGQVPEGFYHIDRFNPASNFYLSLGINYPNASDRIKGRQGSLGGDIFIHGDCVTIGCIPITTPLIKELYIMCVEAKSSGQSRIPVHIYPGKLDDEGWEDLQLTYANKPELIDFWQQMKLGHVRFEADSTIAKVSVATTGEYQFKQLAH